MDASVGESDPEAKRKLIGRKFVHVFLEVQQGSSEDRS
jgi:GMP synthase PP-ATPase subunit